MSEFGIPIAIISLLIFLNGVFVAAEFAIVAASHTRLAQLAESGVAAARRVLSNIRDPLRQNQYIATAQVGITIVSLGLGMYGEHTVAEWLVSPLEHLGRLAEPTAHTIASVLAIGLLTYLHVVLGEMVPKSVALQRPERTALTLDLLMHWVERIFWPLVVALNAIGNAITRLLGVPPPDRHARLFSPEELEFIVEESFARGLLEPTEQLYIENIFDFGERTVGQVMTPRIRIVGLPITATEEEVVHHVCGARYSRYPVYEENLDHIVGVLHLKDLARYRVHRPEPFDLRRLVRPPLFVPESLSLEQMLLRFRRSHTQIAIVLDEFGGTAGLVTLEDIVEDVVGEILDEFDQEIPPMQEVAPGTLRVRGDLLLEELNQHYDLELEHPEADNVSGLMMALLGRVPKTGDEVTYLGVTFKVESVDGLAVQTVLVQLPPAPEPPSEEEMND